MFPGELLLDVLLPAEQPIECAVEILLADGCKPKQCPGRVSRSGRIELARGGQVGG